MGAIELPLFPLRTVLFPQGLLPLRIFEPRYVDMVSRCMKEQSGFGVVLISQGGEVGPASNFKLGTIAHIVDWFQRSDGLLGLHVVGQQRFEIQSSNMNAQGLRIGQVTPFPMETPSPVPPRFRYMAQILDNLIQNLPDEPVFQNPDLDDAHWVVARLAELLPIDLEERQECLELPDAEQRMEYLEPYFSALRDRSGA